MKVRQIFGFSVMMALAIAISPANLTAAPCILPDNGSGTVNLPPIGGPDCGYLSPDDVHMIIAGLPPGTTIILGAAHSRFGNVVTIPGGPLGGEREQFNSEVLMQVVGTGELAGFNRTINMTNVQVVTDTAPRGTGPVQSFDTDMFMMQGQLPPGDPDFDLLRITAGTGMGMPSPGHTTLTRQGPPGSNWAVDSFFDITYRIDFIGSPGGPLAGRSGSTTGTIRMQNGLDPQPCCRPSGQCMLMPPGQCIPSGGSVVSHCPSTGQCVPKGDDCFFTQCGKTQFDFCNDPIPADFFNPGSEPFEGRIYFQGSSPTSPDTVVRRSGAMLLDGPPETIPIELVELSLTSCAPITVTDASGGTSLWNVEVGLSPTPVPPGQMTAVKTHPNGGTFDATFPVQPRFVFTEVGNPTNVRVLDTGLTGSPATVFSVTGPGAWVHNTSLPTPVCGVNFVPGVQENPATLEQCCTETCHDNPAGGHKHCTKRCFVCPRGACCDPASHSCTIADGALACQGQYMGDGTNCNDSDGDGLADVFELNDCCQPSALCAVASSPNNPDTDGDGVLDGDELLQGCDPCVPDCGGGVACCGPLGGCLPNVPLTVCISQGGTVLPAGATCAGDGNQDGIDDACFAPPCVQCGPGDHWIDQTPCPPGDPAVGGVCKLGGVNCLTDQDCTGQCRLAPGQNCLTDADCTGHCEGTPAQNCLVDTDCGGVCSVSGVNCASNADCTAGGNDVCQGNRCLGRNCDNRICNKPNSVGQDTLPSGAVLGIDTTFDCVAETNVIAGGPVTVRKRGPYDDSPSYPGLRPLDNHKDVIDTEILAMSLTGGGVTLRAGTFSGSNQPLPATRGAVAELPTNPALADSFFDVFFEIELSPGSFAYNRTPVRVGQIIDCMPPQKNYYHIGGCIPLYATPNPVPGEVPVGNLVQANHFTYPACCLPAALGGCTPNVSVTKCQQLGGITVAACLGDGNGNGQDDACEQQKCERDATSPTGCKDTCPIGTPANEVCLPSKGGCDPNNFGTCGVVDCDCTDPNFCRLVMDIAGPHCINPCPDGVSQCTLSGDGSFANPYQCRCEPVVTDCAPNSAGTECNQVTCPGPVPPIDKCQKKCGKVDAAGNVVLTDCDCTGVDECHMETLSPGNVAGGPNGCIVPDNGGGTVTLPPAGCDYLSPDDVHMIIDGLPAGTTIELAPIHKDFICRGGTQGGVCSFPLGVDCEEPDGSGGNKECRDSTLQLQAQCVGTCSGGLSGWARTIQLPLSFETHTDPRTPGQPVQSFDTDMFRMFGQITGDPDFDLLRITAGSDFGLPSPGHTTLTQLPGGNWAVDSFFDITYRIDFVGRAGGPFGGMSGSTTGTIRMGTQAPFSCKGSCPIAGQTCNQTSVPQADGTKKICCDCSGGVDPTGACCTMGAAGTICTNTTQSQCQGTFLPGVTCSGITVPCCLPNGVCETMDETCCAAAGGISGLPGASCTGNEACCFQSGTCQNLDPFCCTAQGGTPLGAGTSCLGDNDGNGTDDVCERCIPNATGTGCNPVACPPVVGGATETCQKRCVNFNPATGLIRVTECDCRGTQECHLVALGLPNVAGGPNGCIVPDNGGGTVTLPPAGCDYLSPDDVHAIIDGLPAGTTIELAPIHKDFICRKNTGNPGVCSFPPGVDCEEPDGSGGNKECSESTLEFQAQCVGTCPGGLSGYNRTITIPQVSFETRTGPRTPGQPVQSFDTDMFRLQGQITGDPDFDLLRITAGTGFGMPSPGHTTLTRLPGGSYAVDSFFDITYRIDFVGRAGGPFGGMSGSTTGTIRMATNAPFKCVGGCPPKRVCVQRVKTNPDGTLDICCDCRPKKPIPDITGINKPRFVSFSLASATAASGGGASEAIRVRLVSLHHVNPPYTGGPSIPFTAFEGQVRWVGPPAAYVESASSGIRFVASKLQCNPYYRDWTTYSSCSSRAQLCAVDADCLPSGGTCTVPIDPLLHVTGSALTPSSVYEIEILSDTCMGTEATCPDFSEPLEMRTTRWGDVAAPFNPPDGSVQPAFSDIGVLVDKFKSVLGAPIKARALLIGVNLQGEIDLTPDFNFTHIAGCVDAFKGLPYPHTISSCP